MGGFETVIATSSEEAVAQLQGNGIAYRVMVTGINMDGTSDGRAMAKLAGESESRVSRHLRHRCGCRPTGGRGRSEQRLADQAVCSTQLVAAICNRLNADRHAARRQVPTREPVRPSRLIQKLIRREPLPLCWPLRIGRCRPSVAETADEYLQVLVETAKHLAPQG